MGSPNAWLLTDRILVYNEVLLGRASLDRLPCAVLVWSLSGEALFANAPSREWFSLPAALPDWEGFWRLLAGGEPADDRGTVESVKAGSHQPTFLYVKDRIRNLEGQPIATAAYLSPAPIDEHELMALHEPPLPASDRTLAILLFRDGALAGWTPLSPRWPMLDALAGEPEGRVLEHLSREVEMGRAPQFVPAREGLSDGSVIILAQALDEHIAAASFRHDRLIAATAHEIRNPLATIRGFLQILPGAGADERERYAKIAMREVDRIIEVVNEFLQGDEFSELAAAPVDLVAVAQNALEALRAETAGSGVSLTLEPGPQEVRVVGRATRLAQVVSNLLHNAVESVAAPGGHVWVRVDEDETWARLAVEDDGPGVPEEWAESVFEPAFSRRPGGHGLGLAIARWIVTSHGGTISVQRSHAGGAAFEVTLPRAQVRAPDAKPSAHGTPA